MATDDLYLENLEQWVFDQNKVVTYKWLSTTLDVPINVSKQMLFHFTKQNSSAAIVYFVSGWDVAQQRHVVTLVPKDKLDATKKRFEPIMSVHIYSVSKRIPTDSAVLWTVDMDLKLGKEIEEGTPDSLETHSAIRCADTGLRDKQKRRTGLRASAPAAMVLPAVSIESKTTPMKNFFAPRSNSAPTMDSEPEPAPKPTTPANKKGIQSFFGGATANAAHGEPKPAASDAKANQISAEPAAPPTAAQTKGVASMFAKMAEKLPPPNKQNEPKVESDEESSDNFEDALMNELENKKSNDKPPTKRSRLKRLAASDDEMDVDVGENKHEEEKKEEAKPAKKTAKRGKKAAATEAVADGDAMDVDKGEEAAKKTRKPRKKKNVDAEEGDAAGEGEQEKPKKRKRKSEPQEPVQQEEPEVEESEQQKKFSGFFAHTQSTAAKAAAGKKAKITRKVIVTEKYIDEEGFEVTRDVEKLIEEEIEDAPIVEAPKPKAVPPPTKRPKTEPTDEKPAAAPAKVGQENIMAFFGKKN